MKSFQLISRDPFQLHPKRIRRRWCAFLATETKKRYHRVLHDTFRSADLLHVNRVFASVSKQNWKPVKVLRGNQIPVKWISDFKVNWSASVDQCVYPRGSIDLLHVHLYGRSSYERTRRKEIPGATNEMMRTHNCLETRRDWRHTHVLWEGRVMGSRYWNFVVYDRLL